MIKRAGPLLVLVLFLGVFVWTGWIGLNFGNHWDEPAVIDEVIRPLGNGVFLPGTYNYPSMVFDIGTVALLPGTLPFLVGIAKESPSFYPQPYQEFVLSEDVAPIVAFARSKPFLLCLRAIFLLLTSLTGVWVFLAVRACKRSGWEAAFAAAVILTSWEIAYHARWVAPDALQMQFGALWLMFFCLALHSASRPLLWLRFSAAAAGLACGTKYQGGILLLPVVIHAAIAARASSPSRPIRAMAKELSYNVVIFAAVFLLSTPGVLLQPVMFYQSLSHIAEQYATGHFGHTVEAGGQHGYLLLVYLACVLTSHWPIAALVLSAVACWGIVMIWKESPLTAALFLCAPLIYVAFVVSYRVMIVRNYLLLAPFIAILAARGAFYIWKALTPVVWIRRIVVTGFVAILIANAAFLCFAAQTIGPPEAERFARDIVAYLKKHSGEQYFVSPGVALVAGESLPLSNTTFDPDLAQRYILFAHDANPGSFSCNRLGQYQRVSGPLDVNLDYYPDWQGEPRVMDLSMERAREMELFTKP